MTILVKKVFISSKPTFVYLLCPPLCGPFSIQESAAGGLSYKVKKTGRRQPTKDCLRPALCRCNLGVCYGVECYFSEIRYKTLTA